MDTMFIENLELKCIIGTRPAERVRKQKIILSVCLECDLARAGKTDNLKDAVNYNSLEQSLIDVVEGSSFFLIERLASEVAGCCLAHDRRIVRVNVRVEKPGASIKAGMIGIEIVRGRGRK